MNSRLKELKQISKLVFVFLSLVFLLSAFCRDVVLIYLHFRLDYLLLVIFIILMLYEILAIWITHLEQRPSKNTQESQDKKT
jgi:membrane protein YdbS with pleckstrin-like domain